MIASPFEAMARLFEAEVGPLGPEAPRLNVSPTEIVPVAVTTEDGRMLLPMRWGFLPSWYRTVNAAPLLINARAETLAEKPAFREAVRARRCLIPADGFYEWQGPKGAKTPYAIRPRSGGPMAFAGVWQDWGPSRARISTCVIVTCEANAALTPIHDRMPVIVAPADFALWLGEAGPGAARLLVPAAEDALEVAPVDAAGRAILARRAG